MVQIIAIPPEMLDSAWPDAAPFIQKALDRTSGEILIDDVYNYVRTDRYILLMAIDSIPLGAVTLEIRSFPQHKKVGIAHLGGREMNKWVDMMWDSINKIAKEYGAKSIVWTGRPGWKRFMEKNISHTYYVCEAEI